MMIIPAWSDTECPLRPTGVFFFTGLAVCSIHPFRTRKIQRSNVAELRYRVPLRSVWSLIRRQLGSRRFLWRGGGETNRRVRGVIIVSQIIGGILLLALALLLGETVPDVVHLITGGTAGVCGAFGLVALYRGLAQGRMGVVAPVAAVVTAVLPVVAGVFNEGFPRISQQFGFGMAFVGVWFLSRGSHHAPVQLGDLKLPVLAGIGFGLFFILIDRVSGISVLWPLISARAASGVLFSVFALAGKKRIVPSRNRFLIIALAGIFDTGGNAFFALATRIGRLDISAVISSLYPAATVLLAWLVLKEKLDRSQWVGVVSALAALVLIAI